MGNGNFIRLKGQIKFGDLRRIRIRDADLQHYLKKYNVRDGEGVLLINDAQTRMRVVANFSDVPHLLIPSVSDDGQAFFVGATLYRRCATTPGLGKELDAVLTTSADKKRW